MATKKVAAKTTTVTPATQTELEQYKALKQKIEASSVARVSELIASIKRDLKELVSLKEEFDIHVDFEDLVEGAGWQAGLSWNSSSMHC